MTGRGEEWGGVSENIDTGKGGGGGEGRRGEGKGLGGVAPYPLFEAFRLHLPICLFVKGLWALWLPFRSC